MSFLLLLFFLFNSLHSVSSIEICFVLVTQKNYNKSWSRVNDFILWMTNTFWQMFVVRIHTPHVLPHNNSNFFLYSCVRVRACETGLSFSHSVSLCVCDFNEWKMTVNTINLCWPAFISVNTFNKHLLNDGNLKRLAINWYWTILVVLS